MRSSHKGGSVRTPLLAKEGEGRVVVYSEAVTEATLQYCSAARTHMRTHVLDLDVHRHSILAFHGLPAYTYACACARVCLRACTACFCNDHEKNPSPSSICVA